MVRIAIRFRSCASRLTIKRTQQIAMRASSHVRLLLIRNPFGFFIN